MAPLPSSEEDAAPYELSTKSDPSRRAEIRRRPRVKTIHPRTPPVASRTSHRLQMTSIFMGALRIHLREKHHGRVRVRSDVVSRETPPMLSSVRDSGFFHKPACCHRPG